MSDVGELQGRKLDLATRAAWLYYIDGATQDEIATQFDVSRQSVQRLIALAVSERVIEFRIQSPIAECTALAQSLRARFGLSICEVVPNGLHERGGRPRRGADPRNAICTARHGCLRLFYRPDLAAHGEGDFSTLAAGTENGFDRRQCGAGRMRQPL
jgi:hypothetical protein